MDDLSIRAARLTMPSVPFPAGGDGRGESCRDTEDGFSRVVGLGLGQGFLSSLQRAVGGPRGCFHVFTLMRLVAPSVAWAITAGAARREGRGFERTVVVDGIRQGAGLLLRGTLADLHYASAPQERLQARFEGEATIEVALPSLVVAGVELRVRGSDGSWAAEDPEVTGALEGESLVRGYSLKVGDLLPPRGPRAPLRELLLMVQPVAFQTMPSLSDDQPGNSGARPNTPGVALDSCFMWRRDGALVAEVQRRTDAGSH